MRIYTRTGDKGETSLGGGQRVSKKDCRIELYGNLDELNSCLGVVLNFSKTKEARKRLPQIQNLLFNLGAELVGVNQSRFRKIDQGEVARLEKEIDRLSSKLKSLQDFILPGGSPAAAFLHLARSLCRRAERGVVTVDKKFKVKNKQILVFLNRLSDYLFVLARFENLKARRRDSIWKKY